ncbi:MAG: hypothetical protein ACOCYE_08325 [Pseudomonadota bacterium]
MSTSSPKRRWRRLITVPLGIVLVIVVYLGLGAVLTYELDDDPSFATDVPVPEGGLATLATMAALIERETDRTGWVANDPAFLPGAWLPSMAAYQAAIRDTTRRLAADLADAEGADDPEWQVALDALAVPGDIWAFDFARSWRPQRTSESFYRDAVQALRRLNARISAGTASSGIAPPTVKVILERVDAELNALAEAAIDHVDSRGGHWLDHRTGPRFAAAKGSLYTHLVTLRGLGRDVSVPGGAEGWDAFLASLEKAAVFQPAVVMNGQADSWVRPPHLAVQAALVLRAKRDLEPVRQALAAADA